MQSEKMEIVSAPGLLVPAAHAPDYPNGPEQQFTWKIKTIDWDHWGLEADNLQRKCLW